MYVYNYIYVYVCCIIYIYLYMSKITFFRTAVLTEAGQNVCRHYLSVPLSVQSMADSVFLFHDMDV